VRTGAVLLRLQQALFALICQEDQCPSSMPPYTPACPR
jgi:hypothetical protein